MVIHNPANDEFEELISIKFSHKNQTYCQNKKQKLRTG